jgi:hypothetical protein
MVIIRKLGMVNRVQEHISNTFGVDAVVLRDGAGRGMAARQMATWVFREMFSMKFSEIARLFGDDPVKGSKYSYYTRRFQLVTRQHDRDLLVEEIRGILKGDSDGEKTAILATLD